MAPKKFTPKLSIRKFLLLNLLLAITVTTIITSIGNYYVDQEEIHHNMDNLLSQAGLAFEAFIDSKNIKASELRNIQARINAIPQQTENFFQDQSPSRYEGIYQDRYQFQLWNMQGKLLLRSQKAPTISLASSKEGFEDKKIDHAIWRSFTIRDVKSNLIFVVAEHYNNRNQLARRIMKDDFYVMMLIYPLSGLLIWLIIGRGLSSIRRFANEVAQRAADRLDPIDFKVVPDEMIPLVDELNKLFLRLKQAFDREQRFAADAAHELRTPLAALKTQAQVALRAPNANERHNHLQQVILGVDRCTHVIQQLLTLCRMNPETVTLDDLTEVELPKIAAEVIAQLAPQAIAKHIEIELDAKMPNCVITGNATGIYALIRNLVDNAIRYTSEKGAIKVIIENKTKQILLRVIDNGPGIPAELRSRVFERFFRILGTNTQGSGLGLAIVLQIAKLHGGNVTLSVPESGKGLEVSVSFPCSSSL
jgi:two-component system sensor histidine kinase QseC